MYSITVLTVILVGYSNFLTIYLYVLSMLVFVFSFLDLVVHYWLRSRRIDLSVDVQAIVDNFAFLNKKRAVLIYASLKSPVIMNMGFFRGGAIIMNKKIIDALSPGEMRALLDYELYYGRTIYSCLEQMIQRMFVLSYFPFEILLGKVFPKFLVSYFLSPASYFYTYLVKICRESFVYKGKYLDSLDQVFFKIKTSSYENDFELFSYAFSLKSEDLSQEASRFDNTEIFKW